MIWNLFILVERCVLLYPFQHLFEKTLVCFLKYSNGITVFFYIIYEFILMFYYVFGDLVVFFFKLWFYITYKVYTQVIGYKKTDTSYFIKVPLHDYSIWNHLPMYCLIVHKFIVFFLFAASCIWRCKRVGTRKVIHFEIDIYLAYWYFIF